MLHSIFAKLQKQSAQKKANLFYGFFQKNKESLLDFGCGDFSLAKLLYKANKHLSITGVDVVQLTKAPKNIAFKTYDGHTIPFKDNSFDTVLSVYVFHHCDSAEVSFLECLRVAKKRVIIMEAVASSKREIPLMKFVDWLSNKWKGEDIPLPYQFHTKQEWKKIIKRSNATLYSYREEKNIFSILPIGRTVIFEVIKDNNKTIE